MHDMVAAQRFILLYSVIIINFYSFPGNLLGHMFICQSTKFKLVTCKTRLVQFDISLEPDTRVSTSAIGGSLQAN